MKTTEKEMKQALEFIHLLSTLRADVFDKDALIDELSSELENLKSSYKTLSDKFDVLTKSQRNIEIGCWLGKNKKDLLLKLPEAFDELKQIILKD